MTEPSYPTPTGQLLAQLAAQGRATRVDGRGTVYVKTFTNGRSTWEVAR